MRLLLVLIIALIGVARAAAEDGIINQVQEWSFTSTKAYADPFNEVQVDLLVTTPSGTQLKVPAFWSGGQTWRVRYSSPLAGTHLWKLTCSDATNTVLNGASGSVELKPYTGEHPLYHHGFVKVGDDQRHFTYGDGTPFFWLGDTWWMGLCNRLSFPTDVQKLAADRKAKGFTIIQLVAGLYPDMHPFDPRGANEAGFPWEADYARINPKYWDEADKRISYLVEQGFTPCIVGAWGYFIPWMGVEKMNAHWRYLIARWGAHPVIWCAGGEANLPWYLVEKFPYDDRKQVTQWTQVLRSIRATDPYRRPLTIHPTGIGRLSARNATEDATLLDFDFLQTPHGKAEAIEPTARTMRECYADTPRMPVINGEASYEMLGDSIPSKWTRQMFWVCMATGAAGHTYGANGIWQVNRKGQPHGGSPHHPQGSTGYGTIAWDDAMNLPGSAHMAHGKRFLERFPWHTFVPTAGGATWADGDSAAKPPSYGPFAWGSEAVRLVYVPERHPVTVAQLGAGTQWKARAFDPVSGQSSDLAPQTSDANGRCTVSVPPQLADDDWVLVMER